MARGRGALMLRPSHRDDLAGVSIGGSRTRGVRPERAPHPPRSSNEMTEQTEYELDVGDPEERRDPARQPRSRTRTRWPWRRPIAIIAALAVGVALGAVGVEKERKAAADRVGRTAVQLAAVLVALAGTDPTDDDDLRFHLQIYNSGPEPVEIYAATVQGRGFQSPHDDSTGRVTTKPRRWAMLDAVAGQPDCNAALRPPALYLTARPADGRERRVEVALTDPTGLLATTRDDQCSTMVNSQDAPINAWIGPPFAQATRARKPILNAMLNVELFGGRRIRIISGGHSELLEVAMRRKAATVTSDGSTLVPIELSIRRCLSPEVIDDSDLSLPLHLSYRGEAATARIWQQTAAIVQIVELVHRSCGG
jgi:hypothetical protein